MNRFVSLGVAALLALCCTACVIIDGERVDLDDWREAQRDNREAISQLEIGASRASVVDRLGTPADSEAFQQDGEEIRVLFYRTRHRNADGDTTRDETTPLVFRDDRLVGWGQAVYEGIRR